MNRRFYIDQLRSDADEASQINAVAQLRSAIEDDQVFTALCDAAVETPHARVREQIIAALQLRLAEAGDRFARAAGAKNSSMRRRRALVSLSLLGCRSARTRAAAMQGLDDSDHHVQYAAALSIGLFDDARFMAAAARFLERNRFVLACAGGHRMLFKAARRRSKLADAAI